MATEFKLPELGEGIDEADVSDVLVAVGDVIAKDQPVIEAETDKAAVEIPSDVAGKVVSIDVKKGDTLKVGQVVLTLDAADNGTPAPAKPAPKKETPAPAPTPTPEAAAPQATEAPAPPAAKPQATEAPAQPSSSVGGKRPVPASPSTRQFAREIGVDIQNVPGTGPGGRIGIDDIKKFARENFGKGGPTTGAASSGEDPALPRNVREPMSKVRKVTAAHMEKCWQSPHVTIHDKADVTDLEVLRKKFKPRAQKAGGALTITPIFAKIIAAALKAHPNLNASLDMSTNEVEYHNYYNIGIAVDTPRGLVVPVLKDVDKKSIIDLAVELTEIGVKARDGKLTLDDMRGATFTITNLGSIGVGFFTPIVNNPEVAIMGMGRALMEPVWNPAENGFEPRLMAPLSLSFDHRIVDGADGARFLRWIVEAINSPLLLSLE